MSAFDIAAIEGALRRHRNAQVTPRIATSGPAPWYLEPYIVCTICSLIAMIGESVNTANNADVCTQSLYFIVNWLMSSWSLDSIGKKRLLRTGVIRKYGMIANEKAAA